MSTFVVDLLTFLFSHMWPLHTSKTIATQLHTVAQFSNKLPYSKIFAPYREKFYIFHIV